jgi:hypothetical protein
MYSVEYGIERGPSLFCCPSLFSLDRKAVYINAFHTERRRTKREVKKVR